MKALHWFYLEMSFAAWTLKSASYIILILKDLDVFFFKASCTRVMLWNSRKLPHRCTTISMNKPVLLFPVFPALLCFELLANLCILSL